jgi:hypothetical protein
VEEEHYEEIKERRRLTASRGRIDRVVAVHDYVARVLAVAAPEAAAEYLAVRQGGKGPARQPSVKPAEEHNDRGREAKFWKIMELKEQRKRETQPCISKKRQALKEQSGEKKRGRTQPIVIHVRSLSTSGAARS